MKVEVAVLGFPSLIVLMVSVDVKQHWTRNVLEFQSSRAGLPVHNKPDGLCGQKAPWKENLSARSSGVV